MFLWVSVMLPSQSWEMKWQPHGPKYILRNLWATAGSVWLKLCRFEVVSVEEKENLWCYKTTYCTIQPTHITLILYYIHSSTLSKGLCVRSVLTLRKKLLLYLFLSCNEIFQWHFDYLQLWTKSHLKTDWPFLFALHPLALLFKSAASHLFTLQLDFQYPWYCEKVTIKR